VRRWQPGILALLAAGTFGCRENLATPGDCPALCPGDRIEVRDTVIAAVVGGDSTFVGYTPRNARQVLLVSDGLAAGEYRSFVVFNKHTRDSVLVDGTNREYVIDTVAISFLVEVRDTAVTNLRLLMYRVPATTDSSITFDGLETLLGPENLLDSARMNDTLKTGRVEAVFTGDRLASVLPPAEDSGRFGVGLRVRADAPTGVRIALDPLLTGTGPLFEYRGEALAVADTGKRRQKVQVRLESVARTGYVQNTDLVANANPDLLYLGGPQAARALVRFSVPAFIRDTAQLVRATLILTPASPLVGLPNTRVRDSVGAVGLVVDLGAKSPTNAFGFIPRGLLSVGTSNVVTVDVYSLVSTWQSNGGAPQAIFLQHSAETTGGGFMQPVFYSTRSVVGQPLLRITYGIPTKPGQP
jgi:hypothetical protein